MRTVILGSIIALQLVSPAAAADPEKVKLGLNNASHEFSRCASFFFMVSIALENSKAMELAAKYKTVSDQALEYALQTGAVAGLLKEAVTSRFETDFLSMKDKIGGNTSNVSILNKEHMEPCTATMQNPDAVMERWVAEIENR
ncbi:hypothetical protein [Rhizobium herbae]